VFAAARFSGPRRWAWLSGWASLFIIFLAGVTGYWLLWDERAQLLNEALASVMVGFGLGEQWVSSILTSQGSGWQFLVLIWFGHIITTLAISYFLWRHLRRSTLPWLPPRLWTGLMVGALLVVSLAFPAELLGPADPAKLVDQVPIDPFFLFLLPGLATLPGSLVVGLFVLITGLLSLLPWPIDRGRSSVVAIDPISCTGCQLCVFDCPYKALSMVDAQSRSVAQVDAELCVACGICIGSCRRRPEEFCP
jgi:NAD-dependent dihydropyrimidine dehydrogenase PreA subunit